MYRTANRIAGFCLLTLAAMASPALADTPTELPGTKVVTADDVAKAIVTGAVVIDTRVASEYAEGHIKGALSVPYPCCRTRSYPR